MSPQLRDDMIQHAEVEYPRECCGVLVGVRSRGRLEVRYLRQCANVASDPKRTYSIAPRDLIEAQREARQHGSEIVGFYHSHPNHSAGFSPTDIEQAYWPDCTYVVIATGPETQTEIRAYAFTGMSERERRIKPVAVRVTGA